MKFLTIAAIILFVGITNAVSQQFQTDKESQAEVQKLSFLTGEWKGTGWIMGRDQKKYSFVQTEDIVFKLDSTAILIEGLGKTNGVVTHNALAVVTYNKENGNYRFQSHLANGRGGTFEGELQDDVFYWYPNENMRYQISINENGQWYEKGEIKRNGAWYQYMEMTLDKL